MKTQQLKDIYLNVTPYEWVRSKWGKGVQLYALELLDTLCENHEETHIMMLKKQLLNGAPNWKEYSWRGCSLIHDEDIAKRLATNSKIKSRTYKNGQLNSWANAREQWLDIQSKALYQAYRRIEKILKTWETI